MKKPPVVKGRSDPVFGLLAKSPHKHRLADYLALLTPLYDQGRYLPFDELRYRWAPGLHFALGYEHPFRDGNGRVARALFYWFMFKNDFSAFRYIAISTRLRNAPVKYGRSYLHTEADDLDLTYFIDFQCSVVLRAVTGFTEVYRKSLGDSARDNVSPTDRSHALRRNAAMDTLRPRQ